MNYLCMGMHYFLSALLFSSVILAGCNSNPLTKEFAKQQIIDSYKTTPEELAGTFSFEPVTRGRDSGNNGRFFQLYSGAGLIKMRSADSDFVSVFDITEKGKPWLLKEKLGKTGYAILTVKTFDYYVDEISRIKYSPDKTQAAAFYNLSVKNITPFGDGAADPAHKRFLIGMFRLVNNQWLLERTEIDVERIWE